MKISEEKKKASVERKKGFGRGGKRMFVFAHKKKLISSEKRFV